MSVLFLLLKGLLEDGSCLQTAVFGTVGADDSQSEHNLARAVWAGEGEQMWAGLTNILTRDLGFILAIKNEICRLNESLQV